MDIKAITSGIHCIPADWRELTQWPKMKVKKSPMQPHDLEMGD